MAGSVGTHPVVIRRILGSLRRAGLVSSQSGPGGGWQLCRDAAAMTLLDVYRAVEDEPVLRVHEPGHCCPVGASVGNTLNAIFDRAETAMERQLASVTLASVVTAVRESAVDPSGRPEDPGGGFTLL